MGLNITLFDFAPILQTFTMFYQYFISETQSYVLNFHGRVTQASVKNFQIVHDNDGKFVLLLSVILGEDLGGLVV